MNYYISQIKNLEDCNAGIPIILIYRAAVDIIREDWVDDFELWKAISNSSLDVKAAAEIINCALLEADVRYVRVDEGDIRAALKSWVNSVDFSQDSFALV